jgi:hypothetical protein
VGDCELAGFNTGKPKDLELANSDRGNNRRYAMVGLLQPWFVRGFVEGQRDTRRELWLYPTASGREVLKRGPALPSEYEAPAAVECMEDLAALYDEVFDGSFKLFLRAERETPGEIGPIPLMASPSEIRKHRGRDMDLAESLQQDLFRWIESEEPDQGPETTAPGTTATKQRRRRKPRRKK